MNSARLQLTVRDGIKSNRVFYQRQCGPTGRRRGGTGRNQSIASYQSIFTIINDVILYQVGGDRRFTVHRFLPLQRYAVLGRVNFGTFGREGRSCNGRVPKITRESGYGIKRKTAVPGCGPTVTLPLTGGPYPTDVSACTVNVDVTFSSKLLTGKKFLAVFSWICLIYSMTKNEKIKKNHSKKEFSHLVPICTSCRWRRSLKFDRYGRWAASNWR